MNKAQFTILRIISASDAAIKLSYYFTYTLKRCLTQCGIIIWIIKLQLRSYQDSRCTYVIPRGVRETTVAVAKQQVLHILSVCKYP